LNYNTSMYKEHKSFVLPVENINIWRYTNIAKFLYLIASDSLYFSRADLLQDPYEGSLGKIGKEYWLDSFANIPKDKRGSGYSAITKAHKKERSFIFINSWHLNKGESQAMWKLYAGIQDGIAIVTTIDRLKKCFNPYKNDVYIGKINYIDYKNLVPDPWNMLNAFLCKKTDFEHERELRAVIRWSSGKHMFNTKKREIPLGLNIPISTEILIEKIVLAPHTKPFLKLLIESVCKKYNKKINIERSTNELKPIL